MTPHRRHALAAVLAALVAGCGGGVDRAVPAADDTVVAGPQGAVEHVTVSGSSFGGYGDYSIYLPPGYGQDPQRRYPVVYLLHGGSEGDSFFLELGIREDMDVALGSGAVGPMILVLADGGPSFTGDGSVTASFGDFLASELLPDVDSRWRTMAERTGRAIGGISLGGRQALEFAADHPDLVAAAGGHSTTVPDSPLRLGTAGIPIYLDDGENDALFASDKALARTLRRAGADVSWHPAEGGHDRRYWSAHLPDYLRFYSDALGAAQG